ncbi:hypothetical protein F7725_022263 [Dissostichus mawsoni]|uniref:Uncharacterized protein n=1 Tax=Dissostichus mawsoni TaxID=36200 RepID=A0A7J5Z1M0_DISMA|nr:hypothetical protein F7725_022263 [Dissostichus mawsoni]
MPKRRRGRGGARGDLWTLAGGEDRVLQSFIAIGILPNPISSSSEVWSRLAFKMIRRRRQAQCPDQVKEESELELLNDDDRNDDIAKQGTE